MLIIKLLAQAGVSSNSGSIQKCKKEWLGPECLYNVHVHFKLRGEIYYTADSEPGCKLRDVKLKIIFMVWFQ